MTKHIAVLGHEKHSDEIHHYFNFFGGYQLTLLIKWRHSMANKSIGTSNAYKVYLLRSDFVYVLYIANKDYTCNFIYVYIVTFCSIGSITSPGCTHCILRNVVPQLYPYIVLLLQVIQCIVKQDSDTCARTEAGSQMWYYGIDKFLVIIFSHKSLQYVFFRINPYIFCLCNKGYCKKPHAWQQRNYI